MKIEHIENLKIMRQYMRWDPQLGERENKENGKKYFAAVDFLCESKAQDVLEALLDFFTHENEQYGGVCETLKSQIGVNFTLDQLLQAFYKKFNTLAENDLSICSEMSMWCVRNDCRDKFRQMFNTVRSKHSKEIVENLKKSALEYDWEEDSKEMIYTLEEDMKNW
ncbi:MAG: hypothetical protein LBI61_01230 [Puniceicoccales bacterium]|jgi:hypothetical protein|nr:hypothetical protein [Puniceicoccales bacterium]